MRTLCHVGSRALHFRFYCDPATRSRWSSVDFFFFFVVSWQERALVASRNDLDSRSVVAVHLLK